MRDMKPALVELLNERLRMVQVLSGMNARHLLNRQIAAGTEIAILQIEQEVVKSGASPAKSAALRELQERRDKTGATMEAEGEALSALELQLAEIDRQIAAGGRQ
jgi:flagellar biosynthesis GTPase FlhF